MSDMGPGIQLQICLSSPSPT